MPTVAVTGATGFVGGRTAARLAARGLAPRLLVRDPARAPELPGADVRTIGGYADADGMRAALAGVSTLFLVPAHETADRVEQHATAIHAARDTGVEHVVYLSYLGASEQSTFTLGRQHAATEQVVRASGLPHTFLRMNLYLDFIPLMTGEDGVIRGPAGEGRLSAVAREDVAAAAAAVLADATLRGGIYELTGPTAFTLAEAAATITRHTGRTVTFHDETEDEAYASRAGYGAPDWQVEAWVSTYTAIRAGELARVSADVERLTGAPPMSLDDLLGG